MIMTGAAVLAIILGAATLPAATPDLGKRACAQEARRLCPQEMQSLSRKRVEACMITRIEQTSTQCHAAMLRIRAQRQGDTREGGQNR
ncbi:MAG: hypothetical protein KGN34_01155 [Sphingomonadales bacterium]|nr:hypothetical protein [Sphingomonadales bacterium]